MVSFILKQVQNVLFWTNDYEELALIGAIADVFKSIGA